MERIEVTRGGATFGVERHGSGRPVVLAHGLLCSARLFDDVVPALVDDGLEVIVPTFRDHPGSGASPSRWTLTDLLFDLVATLDQLGHPRAVFAGFSMGGMTSMRLALRYPERVASLALLSTSAGAERPRDRVKFTALAYGASAIGPFPPMLGIAVNILFHRDYQRREPERVRAWRNDVQSMSGASIRRAVLAVATRADVRPELHLIQAATHVLVGSDDGATPPRRARDIAAGISGASLVQAQGIGHSTPMESPAEVIATVRAAVADARWT